VATELTSGVTLNGETVTGSTPPVRYTDYFITVPSGQGSLTVTFTNVTANPQLLVNFGSVARATDYDYASTNGTGQNETVVVTNPAAGTWYIAALKPLASINPGDVNPTYSITATYDVSYDVDQTAYTRSLELVAGNAPYAADSSDQEIGAWTYRPDYEAHTVVCVDIASDGAPVSTIPIKIIDAHVTDLERAYIYLPTPGVEPPTDEPSQLGNLPTYPAFDYYGFNIGDGKAMFAAGHYGGPSGNDIVGLQHQGGWDIFDIATGYTSGDSGTEADWVNTTGSGGAANPNLQAGRLIYLKGFSRDGDDSIYFLKVSQWSNIYRFRMDTLTMEVDGNNDYVGTMTPTAPKGSFCYGMYLSQPHQPGFSVSNRWVGATDEDYFLADWSYYAHTAFFSGDRIVVMSGHLVEYGGRGRGSHYHHVSFTGYQEYPGDTTDPMRCDSPSWPWNGTDSITAVDIPAVNSTEETWFHNEVSFAAGGLSAPVGWTFRLYKSDGSTFTYPNSGNGGVSVGLFIEDYQTYGRSELDTGDDIVGVPVGTMNPRYWEVGDSTPTGDATTFSRPRRDFQRVDPWIYSCRVTAGFDDAVDRLQHYDGDFASAFAMNKFPSVESVGSMKKVPVRMVVVDMPDGAIYLVGGYYPCAGHAWRSINGSFSLTATTWGGTDRSGGGVYPAEYTYFSFVNGVPMSAEVTDSELLFHSGGRTGTWPELGKWTVVAQNTDFSAPRASEHIWKAVPLTGVTSASPVEYHGDMTMGRFGCAAVAISDTEILISGGFSVLPQSLSAIANAIPERSIEIYNTVTKKSSVIGYMSKPRAFHTANLVNNHVLFAGGETLGPSPRFIDGFYPQEGGEYVFRDDRTGNVVFGHYEVFSLSSRTVTNVTTVPYGPRRMHATVQVDDDADGRKRFVVYVGVIGFEREGYMLPYPVRPYGSQIKPWEEEGVGNVRYFEPDYIMDSKGGPTYRNPTYSGDTRPGQLFTNKIPYIITLEFP
jgi:hypothetical protein